MGTSVTLVKQFGNPTFNSLTVSGSTSLTGSINVTGSITAVGSVTATMFTGSGAGLTGTAASLSIGGTSNNITAYTINQSVGTSNSPSFQQVYAYDWFRSYGSTGWYNQDYGGGIYMIDSTWVRVYNSKAFYVANSMAATGDVTAYYSDIRLKTKVGNIENAIDKVKSLSGFYYVNNELAKSVGYKENKKQVALSAQDVQAIMPEVVSLAPFDMETTETGEIVSKSGENYLTVNYAKLVPLLVEAIKEQQAQIEELKTTINGLTR